MEKDALNGTRMVSYFAMIAAWVGDKDLACEQLAIAIGHSSDLSYGQLSCCRFGIRCAVIHASKKSSHPWSRNNFPVFPTVRNRVFVTNIRFLAASKNFNIFA